MSDNLLKNLTEGEYYNEQMSDVDKRLIEANTRLSDENRMLKKELKREYKAKEKAIEYINKNILIGFDKAGFSKDIVAGIVVNELLKILKGDEYEEQI